MGLISSKNIFLCLGNYMQMSVNTGTHMKMSEKLERGPPQDNNSTFIQTDAANSCVHPGLYCISSNLIKHQKFTKEE